MGKLHRLEQSKVRRRTHHKVIIGYKKRQLRPSLLAAAASATATARHQASNDDDYSRMDSASFSSSATSTTVISVGSENHFGVVRGGVNVVKVVGGPPTASALVAAATAARATVSTKTIAGGTNHFGNAAGAVVVVVAPSTNAAAASGGVGIDDDDRMGTTVDIHFAMGVSNRTPPRRRGDGATRSRLVGRNNGKQPPHHYGKQNAIVAAVPDGGGVGDCGAVTATTVSTPSPTIAPGTATPMDVFPSPPPLAGTTSPCPNRALVGARATATSSCLNLDADEIVRQVQECKQAFVALSAAAAVAATHHENAHQPIDTATAHYNVKRRPKKMFRVPSQPPPSVVAFLRASFWMELDAANANGIYKSHIGTKALIRDGIVAVAS